MSWGWGPYLKQLPEEDLNFALKLRIVEILLTRHWVGVGIHKQLLEEDLNFAWVGVRIYKQLLEEDLNFVLKLQIVETLLARQWAGVRFFKPLPKKDLNFALKLQFLILLARQWAGVVFMLDYLKRIWISRSNSRLQRFSSLDSERGSVYITITWRGFEFRAQTPDCRDSPR